MTVLLLVDDMRKLACAGFTWTVCPIFWDCVGAALIGADAALTGRAMGKECKDIPAIFATVVGTVCSMRIAFADCVFAVVVITCDVLRLDRDVTV